MRSSRCPRAVSVALLACLPLACGCVYVGSAVGISLATDSGGSGGGAAAPAPPSLAVASSLSRPGLIDGSGQPSATQVRIDYALADASSASLTLDVHWRRASEPDSALRVATEGASSDGRASLASAPDPGIAHKFVWNAGADLARAGFVEENVIVRMTPARPDATGASKDVAILAGNRAPTVTIVTGTGVPVVSRNVVTTFFVSDTAADDSTVTFTAQDVTAPGRTRTALVNLLVAPGAPTTVLGSVTGSRTGLVWDSTAAFGFTNVTQVAVTVYARDRFGLVGTATATVDVENDSPSGVRILNAGTAGGNLALGGRVPILFQLFDPEADVDPQGPGGMPVDVLISTDGGTTFFPPTGVTLRRGGELMGIPDVNHVRAHAFPHAAPDLLVPPFAPEGNLHEFLWDAAADGLAQTANIVVMITPEPGVGFAIGRDITTSRAASQQPLFGSPIPVPGLNLPIATADLNNDGIPDILSPGAAALGNGDGTFQVVSVPATVGGTLGDVNGDGNIDTVYTYPGTVAMRFGDGFGGFGPEAVVTSSARLTLGGTALADLNGDGTLDLVYCAAVAGSSSFFVCLNTGQGAFAAPLQLPISDSSGSSWSVTVADLDGDGLPDLVGSALSGTSIRMGTGGGGFGPEIFTASTVGLLGGILIGDVDGDGRLDLVAGGNLNWSGVITVRYGQPPGAPGTAILFGPGKGGFGPENVVSRGYAIAAALLDLNGDGRLDLLLGLSTAGRGTNDAVVLGLDPRRFGSPFPVDSNIIVNMPPPGAADWNGDGQLDVCATIFASPTLAVELSTVGTGFQAEPVLNASPSANAVRAADLNGDGFVDTVTLTPAALSVRFGMGAGAFAPEHLFSVGGIADGTESGGPNGANSDLALADMNNDFFLDAVVDDNVLSPGGNGRASVCLDNAALAGTFLPELLPLPAIGFESLALAVGDMNNDGVMDLVTTSNGEGSSVPAGLRVRLGVLAGRPPTPSYPVALDFALPGPTPMATGVALGDLNGDGFLDVVVADGNAGSVVVFLGTGTPSLLTGPVQTLAVGARARPFGVVLGDIDGDGLLDLVVADTGVSDARVFFGRGDGTFSAPTILPTPVRSGQPFGDNHVALGDLDGDGRLDIAVSNKADGTVNVFRQRRPATLLPRPEGSRPGRGDGQGAFVTFFAETVTALNGLSSPRAIEVSDVTDDGVADILVAGTEGVQVLSAISTRASRSVPDLFGAAPSALPDVRSLPIDPIDPLAFSFSGSGSNPQPALRARAGSRFAPASLACVFMPETATLSANAPPIPLALHAEITAAELASSVIRVFRNDQDDSGPGTDPRFGTRVTGTIVEAARRDPADPTGGSFPQGVAVATVVTSTGRVTFPSSRLGRFEAFLEVPSRTAVLLRETFDAGTHDSLGIAPRPPSWAGSDLFKVGTPSPADLAGALRPLPASAPNLLATGLRGDIPAQAPTHQLFAPPFTVTALNGRRARLRFLEWHDLGAGNSCVMRLNGSALVTFTGRTQALPAPPVLQSNEIDITPSVSLAGPNRILLQYTSGGTASSRGWFLDDLEVVLAP